MPGESSRPSISIVMPFRDEDRFLAESLRSITSQTRSDWELVAIDDHSTDESVVTVRELAATDPRVRLHRSRGNGIVAALETGIDRARAAVIARMDSDDVMTQDRLATQLEALEANPALGLISSRVRMFPRNQLRAGFREYERWQNTVLTEEDVDREIFFESPFAHPSVAIRRDRLAQVGGYRSGPFPEDYDLWLRMHAAGIPMAKHPDVLLHWRDRPDRASRTDPRYSRDAFDRLRAHYLARDRRVCGNRPIVVWGAGRRTRARARLLIGEGIGLAGWIDIDPRKIGRTHDGVEVHGPDWLDQTDIRPLVLVYVRNHGARALIADRLASSGYEPGSDWLPVG